MTDAPLPADSAPDTITDAQLAAAEQISGLSFTTAERDLMRPAMLENRAAYARLRAVTLPNDVPPAFTFHPYLPSLHSDPPLAEAYSVRAIAADPPPLPADLEEVAFWPIPWLAKLIETRQLTSTALTEMYLARLKRYDPILHCVVTLTEDLAHRQAVAADAEIAAGQYRGLLHGIPWGVKDLFAVANYPTGWGSPLFKDQVFDYDATVVQRLEEAGAVLIAKLSVGELAWGDVWYGGMTRTPWDTSQGSSGSSAGSASAVAGGLVAFAIGTETYGSIVSPSMQCRVTGLRPTPGRVSRDGAMMLAWTMDKVGPIARRVEDCALVFAAIAGPDAKDKTLVDKPFRWPDADPKALRVGYIAADFEAVTEFSDRNHAALDTLRAAGYTLTPIALPPFPIDALGIILSVEAAATFDDLTRSDRDDQMVRQVADAWPNFFRQAHLIPAVEYVQAQRVRELIARRMAATMIGIDVYLAAPGSDNLLMTNLIGYPSVVVPNGVGTNSEPASMTFNARPYHEADALTIARVYQEATDFHLAQPPFTSSADPVKNAGA